MSAHAFEVAMAGLGVNGPEDVTPTWDAVRWRVHEGSVRRLRQRIFKATQDGDLARVRNLHTCTALRACLSRVRRNALARF
jgi:RNA-directed DNA polymerase